jgi:hypothetical protein
MAESNSEFIEFLLPFLAAQLGCPENPDPPFPSPSPDKAIVRGVCAALKISESHVWSELMTYCHAPHDAVH